MTYDHDQQLLALGRANEMRRGYRELKKQIHSLPGRQGRMAVANLLEDPDDIVSAIELGVLLDAIRRMGRITVRQACWRLDVNPTYRVRELTPGQRARLIEWLRS